MRAVGPGPQAWLLSRWDTALLLLITIPSRSLEQRKDEDGDIQPVPIQDIPFHLGSIKEILATVKPF
eukprot:g39994.t1